MAIVENIKLLCEENGLSIPKLEKSLGFSKGSVYNWDTNSPSIDKVQKVATYFNVSADDLIYGYKANLDKLKAEFEKPINPNIDNDPYRFENILKIFAHYILKYKGTLTDSQAISSGIKGLKAALKTFDPLKGAKFLTYAARCIESEILIKVREAERDKHGEIDEISGYYPIETIAAHYDGNGWGEEELEEIERFKEFVKSKRTKE